MNTGHWGSVPCTECSVHASITPVEPAKPPVVEAEVTEGASSQVEGAPPQVVVVKKVYVSPKLIHLGSVRDVTFGATGQRADLRGGRRPRRGR
jgi:hypothetical protein